ncbi:MAG: DUF1223 domain-containing protein [Robiginitomaculum sp.]|nr:DUF1223 domain-containing protein [Robiginitomaculum sp.]
MIARSLLALMGVLVLAMVGHAQDNPPAGREVVVELFTSQGCPNCPRANAFLADLSTQKDVIALSFAVDYWDYLGWRDTFAMPEFTARQYAYGTVLGTPRVYTPQIIIDGRKIYKGMREKKVRKAVEQQLQNANTFDPDAPRVQAHLNAEGKLVLDISGSANDKAAIWMAAYTPGAQSIEVKGGENKGKKMLQVNMVTGLTKLADWAGGHTRMVLPMPEEGGCAILLQANEQGPILAAAKVES